MKKVIQTIITLLVALVIVNQTFSQKPLVDRLVIPLSNPNKPGFIKVGLINGGITVTGYNGKEVIVEATVRTTKISDHGQSEKGNGMMRIPIIATGLSAEEENNEIDISVESWKRTIDVDIRVPKKTSMKLNCINAGDIIVKNVAGELDVNNINGKVTLENVSGTVVAHALNKDLVVSMAKVDSKKPMSFSTLNGDVDVTFPEKLKADVKLKSTNGEIYTDFEIKLDDKPRKIIEENGKDKGGKYRVKIDRTIYGKINGGGPEFLFKSFNGDIFIRKSR